MKIERVFRSHAKSYEQIRQNPASLCGEIFGDYTIESTVDQLFMSSTYDLFYLARSGNHVALARVLAPNPHRPKPDERESYHNFPPLKWTISENGLLNFVSELDTQYASLRKHGFFIPDYLQYGTRFVPIEPFPRTTLELLLNLKQFQYENSVLGTKEMGFWLGLRAKAAASLAMQSQLLQHLNILHGNIQPKHVWVYGSREAMLLHNLNYGLNKACDSDIANRIIEVTEEETGFEKLNDMLQRRDKILKYEANQFRKLASRVENFNDGVSFSLATLFGGVEE